MMKLVVAIACLAVALSIPVEKTPEAAPAAPAPAPAAPATEAPATEAPATEAPATEAPATEAPATPEAERRREQEGETPAAPAATTDAEAERTRREQEGETPAAPAATTDAEAERRPREQEGETPAAPASTADALNEVVSLVSVMAGAKNNNANADLPITEIMNIVNTLANGAQNNEDGLPIGDLMQAGMSLITQSQKIQQQIEASGILNEDPATLLGVKEDGSFDLNEAADKISGLMTMFGVPALTAKEKGVMHDIVNSFQNALKEGNFQQDMEKIVGQVTNKVDSVSSKVSKHDNLLDAETLLEVVEAPTEGLDTKLMTDVAGRFMTTMQQQFDFATEKLNEL